MVAALLFCAASPAHAITDTINPPPGFYSGRIFIGTTQSGSHRVVYMNNLNSKAVNETCFAPITINPNNVTIVKASNGPDEVVILYGTQQLAGCSGQGETLKAFTPATMQLQVQLGDGNDLLWSTSNMPNLSVLGSYGADVIKTGVVDYVQAGSGEDKLIIHDHTNGYSNSRLYGESSADLFCEYGAGGFLREDGGSNTDWAWYAVVTATYVVDTEGHSSQPPCDAAYTDAETRAFDYL